MDAGNPALVTCTPDQDEFNVVFLDIYKAFTHIMVIVHRDWSTFVTLNEKITLLSKNVLYSQNLSQNS